MLKDDFRIFCIIMGLYVINYELRCFIINFGGFWKGGRHNSLRIHSYRKIKLISKKP